MKFVAVTDTDGDLVVVNLALVTKIFLTKADDSKKAQRLIIHQVGAVTEVSDVTDKKKILLALGLSEEELTLCRLKQKI